LVPVTSAQAHAKLMSTSPPAGATVAPPAAVVLRFDDVVQLPPRSLRVTGPNGEAVPAQASLPNSKTLEGSLPRRLGAGSYKARWRIVADDGHIESGSLSFAVRATARRAAAVVAGSPTSSRGGGAAAVVLTLLLSMVTIAAIGTGLVRLRKERAVR
jgi:copper resistance protein C